MEGVLLYSSIISCLGKGEEKGEKVRKMKEKERKREKNEGKERKRESIEKVILDTKMT